MNNLPITANAPQAAAKPTPAAVTDDAAPSQPFGDVLARQVADATPADSIPQPKKATAKSAEEIFARINAQGDTASALSGPAMANLPTDMLAALLPQGMNIAAPQMTVPAETSSVPKQGAPAAAPGTPVAAAPTDAKKDAAFTGMLDTMGAAPANKVSAAEEKPAAVAPQPAAAALASMQAAQPVPSSVLPAQVTINTPVTQDKWGDEFNQKITWLATGKEQSAELHLNPPQLGPMDVVLKVSGDQASALFTSPHAAVRDAIEQALPKLREMMADNGIMLGNATVSDQAPRNGQDGADSRSPAPRSGVGGIADAGVSASQAVRVSPISRHNGIVDTFA
ncbi:MAG: flagellar hook-length control protein FliK [Gallionellaceae bacterium]|nr:MAG: flagellar hook-length control protein FliK [Gallionellaceae bacterium]